MTIEIEVGINAMNSVAHSVQNTKPINGLCHYHLLFKNNLELKNNKTILDPEEINEEIPNDG